MVKQLNDLIDEKISPHSCYSDVTCIGRVFQQETWTNLLKKDLSAWEQLNGTAPFKLKDGVVAASKFSKIKGFTEIEE